MRLPEMCPPAMGTGVEEVLAAIPADQRTPAFNEPWEAQAFALTLALLRRGAFTWSEWSATLGEEIKRAQESGDADSGTTYYRHWLAAVERLVRDKGLATDDALHRYRDAWNRAAGRTPHGEPIVLEPRDLT
jgi:nitrile hydratase accessory protein